MLPRICIVTDRKLVGNNFLSFIEELLKLDFNFIQLREKDLSPWELYKLAKDILEISSGKVILTVNDRVDVAYLAGAKGVHLGVSSLPSHIVKDKFTEMLIGISVHNVDELKQNTDFDYVFFGNVYETDCKPEVRGKGLDLLKEIVNKTDKPVYAIGGIAPDNVLEVLKTGAYGVAVRSLPVKDMKGLIGLRKIIGEYYG